MIINISSDAGAEHYASWGGYGSTKAALDHQTLTWAAEEPQFTWYAVDPGDLRTAMHQAAFPGEDISDRPEPETVAPTWSPWSARGRPSGRYRAADLLDHGSRRRVRRMTREPLTSPTEPTTHFAPPEDHDRGRAAGAPRAAPGRRTAAGRQRGRHRAHPVRPAR